MYTAFSVIVRWAAYGGKRRVVLPSKGRGHIKVQIQRGAGHGGGTAIRLLAVARRLAGAVLPESSVTRYADCGDMAIG